MSDTPDDPAPVHKRRPRYRGTHPRRFEERYKELDSGRYPGIVPHVLAKGRTPAGQHVPIMVDEIIEALAPRPGERVVDVTLGYGGHARRLLDRVLPGGALLGLDADPLELPRTEARLREAGYGPEAFTARRCNFAGLAGALAERGWGDGADVVLADLGLSSMQIDNPARGFGYGADGPLDMRMNPNRGLAAAEWLERAGLEQLVRAFRDNADEPAAEPLAEALVARRGHLRTTRDLADAVLEASRWLGRDDGDASVRRVFQALRIEVNDEFGALDALLRALPGALRPGGRAAILSFHSGEDRRVKHAFAAGERDGTFAAVAPEVIRATPAERHANPRSKPAKLRWARRAGEPGGSGTSA